MPLTPATTYASLNDNEIILGNDIVPLSALPQYREQIMEILLLPKDMITLGKHTKLREVPDVSGHIDTQSLIQGTIDGKPGFWDLATGKFVGEENMPGRNPRHDVRMNFLEEDGRYRTAEGKMVNLHGPCDAERIVFECGYALSELLGFTVNTADDDQFQKDQEFLGKQTIVSGTLDNQIMPSGYWHLESGLCFGGNTGGLRGDKFYDLLHRSRIIDNKQR